MRPIYNPPIPSTTQVSLFPGFMLHVNGMPTGNRFSVNFKCGPGPNANNALHFNVRFDDGFSVVRNTMRNNSWEHEERQASGFPFQQHKPFEIIFLCQQHQWKVAVNGQHFIEYKHRVPIHNIKFLVIQGNVSIQQLRFDQESAGPPKITYNPSLPYNMPVPFNNIKGRSITINGMPENRPPHRLMLDFMAGSDIVFHFNPRFDQRTIVRNAQLRQVWGPEERNLSVPFPFQYSVPFQITVSVDQQCFRVELNGMVICTFNHRERPLNRIKNVCIGGSVSINQIAFK